MKKTYLLLALIVYFSCSEKYETEFSDELISNTRTETAVNLTPQCSDKDNDDFCDDDDYWPLDPEMNENLWGVKNDSEPNFYFTYDIDEAVQEAINDGLSAATAEAAIRAVMEVFERGGTEQEAMNACRAIAGDAC